MVALEDFLIRLIRTNGITHVWIEQNFISDKSAFNTVMALAGYMLFAATAGQRNGCRVSTVELSTWRSQLGLPTRGPKTVLADPNYARFKGRKTGLKEAQRQWVKDRALEYARKHGSDPKDDNEADAICIWHHKAIMKRARIAEVETKTDLFADLQV